MSIIEELPSDSEEMPLPPNEGPTPATIREIDIMKCETLKKDGNDLFLQGKISEALALYREALKFAPLKPVRVKKPVQPPSTSPPLHSDSTATENNENKNHNDDKENNKENTKEEENSNDNNNNDKDDDGDDDDDDIDYTLTSQVYCNAGLCLSKLELYQEAEDYLTEAIRHNKLYTKAYLRRAECYYIQSKWSNAFGDYEEYEKLGGIMDPDIRAHKTHAKAKVDEEMQKMLGDLKSLGNRFLGYFGLSTDNFKFDKDPNTGGYSMRFER